MMFCGTFAPAGSHTEFSLPLQHHIQTLSFLMMRCKCLHSCFQGARSVSRLHLAPCHLLIPGHPFILFPTSWLHLSWPSQGEIRAGLIGWYQLNGESNRTHRGQWVEFAPASYLCSVLRLWDPSPYIESMPHSPPLQPNLSFHYTAISFSLHFSLFPHLTSLIHSCRHF